MEEAVIVSVAPSGPHGTGQRPHWNSQGIRPHNRHEPFREHYAGMPSHHPAGEGPPPLPPKGHAGQYTASPGLETHFDVSDLNYPRTVMHNIDNPDYPYIYNTTNTRKQQRPSFSGTQGSGTQHGTPHQRPSSSAEVGSPYHFFQSHNTSGSSGGSGAPGVGRPTSALGYGYNDPSPYLHLGRNLPTPNGQLTTSVKSVFDCDLGCFVDKVISEEVTEAQITTTTTITKPAEDENMLVTDVLMTETSVTKSKTEQISSTKQKPTATSIAGEGSGSSDDAENLLIPLVDNSTSSAKQDAMTDQQIRTSEPRDV